MLFNLALPFPVPQVLTEHQLHEVLSWILSARHREPASDSGQYDQLVPITLLNKARPRDVITACTDEADWAVAGPLFWGF